MENRVHLKKPKNLDFELECVACYVQCGDKLLYLKKAPHELLKNLWGVPAGKVKPDETLIQGMIRELAEETGLVVTEDALTYIQPLFVESSLRNFILNMLQYKPSTRPEIELSHEHTEYQWTGFKEILSLPLISGAEKSLEVYQQFIQ